MESVRTVIARWESDGGKYRVELYRDKWGYGYDGRGCGAGNLGRDVTEEADAVAWMEARTATFPASRTGNFFHPGKRPMRRTV